MNNVIEFPNPERERDEMFLQQIAELEAMGIHVIVENLLDQFLGAPTDADRRAFERIAGIGV